MRQIFALLHHMPPGRQSLQMVLRGLCLAGLFSVLFLMGCLTDERTLPAVDPTAQAQPYDPNKPAFQMVDGKMVPVVIERDYSAENRAYMAGRGRFYFVLGVLAAGVGFIGSMCLGNPGLQHVLNAVGSIGVGFAAPGLLLMQAAQWWWWISLAAGGVFAVLAIAAVWWLRKKGFFKPREDS